MSARRSCDDRPTAFLDHGLRATVGLLIQRVFCSAGSADLRSADPWLRYCICTARLSPRGRPGLSARRGTRADLAHHLDGNVDRLHDGNRGRSGRYFCPALHDVDPAVYQPAGHAFHAAFDFSKSNRRSARLSPHRPVEPRFRRGSVPRWRCWRADRPVLTFHTARSGGTISLYARPCAGLCRCAYVLQSSSRHTCAEITGCGIRDGAN